jgi:hypothetical protein
LFAIATEKQFLGRRGKRRGLYPAYVFSQETCLYGFVQNFLGGRKRSPFFVKFLITKAAFFLGRFF